MESVEFHYHSYRAQKARIGQLLVKWQQLLAVVAILLILAGVGLVIMGSALGWALIGVAAVPAMVIEWYKNELLDIAVAKKPQTIDDMLSSDVLGRLPKQPTPRDLATIVGSVQSCRKLHRKTRPTWRQSGKRLYCYEHNLGLTTSRVVF